MAASGELEAIHVRALYCTEGMVRVVSEITPNQMDKSGFVSKFLALEKQLGLFQFKVYGVHIWWFIRNRAFSLLHSKLTGVNLRANVDSLGSLGALRMALRALPHLRYMPSARSDILAVSTASARRHLTEDGLGFDVFFDFLSCIKEYDYTVLEMPDRMPHFRPAYSPKVFYGDYLSLVGNIGRSIATYNRCSGVLKQIRDELLNLSDCVNIPLSLEEAERLVSREAAFVRVTLPIARSIIHAVRPKVMLVESGTDPSHLVLQLAAKELGIPVMEIQHGLISSESLAFFFDIAQGTAREDIPYPDKMLVFGKHFKRVLREHPSLPQHDIIPIGYPYLWLEYMKSKASHHAGSKPHGILITSQPGLGAFWADAAVKLANMVDKPVSIKPHPAEMDRIDSIFHVAAKSGKVSIIRDHRSLYDLFPTADWHLSAGSTSHLEAIVFGLNDIIVSAYDVDRHFKFLRDMGLPWASTPEEIAETIRSYPDIGQVREYVSDEVFSLDKNPIEEFRTILERCV